MYTKVIYRVDEVKKVPAWAESFVKVGEKVIRTEDNAVITQNGNLKLGRSYTKEYCWTQPQTSNLFENLIRLVRWYNS